ncbi:MAG: D-alanyl-D-alanine carboxypeptidase [Ruminococcus sp.]|nr:D-alanyl-D-alanine carboxypeptidase [Ruminococcus sp.]
MKNPAAIFLAIVITVTSFSPNIYAEDNIPDPEQTVPAVTLTAPANISAQSYVLMEADSRRVIFGKNENTRRPMASTTKIMTTLLTLESGNLDTEFTVDSTAVLAEGSSMGLLPGDIVTKRDLCIGMLLPSGNDAANCAAVKISGSMENFADLMNARAARLKLTNTHFVTPSGLHSPDHYSTALDMARLASVALKNPDFAAICRETSITLDYGNPPYRRTLTNTNKLLNMYPGCIGVKTGFTDEAGRCLVSAAERDGVRLVCVTLNAPNDWNDHTALLDSGFSLAERKPFTNNVTVTVNVAGGTSDTVTLTPAYTPEYTAVTGQTTNITRKISVPPLLFAPVKSGDPIGTLTLWDGETPISSVPMTAAEDIPLSPASPPTPNFLQTLVKALKEKLKALFL